MGCDGQEQIPFRVEQFPLDALTIRHVEWLSGDLRLKTGAAQAQGGGLRYGGVQLGPQQRGVEAHKDIPGLNRVANADVDLGDGAGFCRLNHLHKL